MLVSSSHDGTLRVWDLQTSTALRVLAVRRAPTLAGSPHHELVALVFDDDSKLLSAKTGAIVELGPSGGDIVFSLNGLSLLATGCKSQASVWDLRPLLDYGQSGVDFNLVGPGAGVQKLGPTLIALEGLHVCVFPLRALG